MLVCICRGAGGENFGRPDKQIYGATPARFYILFAFCMLSFNQCLFWITFSPIASNAKLYYGIDDSTIALLMNWGPIVYIPVCFVTSWLTAQKNGLRRVCVGSSVVTAAFMVIRCVPSCKVTHTESLRAASWFPMDIAMIVRVHSSHRTGCGNCSQGWAGRKHRASANVGTHLPPLRPDRQCCCWPTRHGFAVPSQRPVVPGQRT